jgi:hypothetical protein
LIYPQDHTARHQFHLRTNTTYKSLLCFSRTEGVLLFFLPETIIWYGVILAVGVGFYFGY